jgi:hypothetical protein
MWWTAPAPGIEVHRVIVTSESHEGAVQMQVTTIGLDIVIIREKSAALNAKSPDGVLSRLQRERNIAWPLQHAQRHRPPHTVCGCGGMNDIHNVFQRLTRIGHGGLTSRHMARSAYPASLASVHCVLLGSLLTTLAVQPSRCRRFIGTLFAPIKYASRALRIEQRRRRGESLAFDLQKKTNLRRTVLSSFSAKTNSRSMCKFSVSNLCNLKNFEFANFDFCGDGPPVPRAPTAKVNPQKVCVIPARHWLAKRRRPAHTCLLRPKLHAVDALSSLVQRTCIEPHT